MSTTQVRVDGAVDGQRDAVRAMLDRQRKAFMAEGPPSVTLRRNRIDRLLALAQMIPSAASFGGVGRSGMGAYHGKAGFDAFSHYRTVVGSDLPFSVTGRAAPPFSGSMKAGVGLTLRMARGRTRRRLNRSR